MLTTVDYHNMKDYKTQFLVFNYNFTLLPPPPPPPTGMQSINN